MAVLVVIIRLTSRGPGIFRQQRVGKHGRVFTMLKLRSMRVDAECRCGAIWASLDDPRTTPIGKLLRRFHLDELPQLFNILRGEMSLVGPRPERPEFVRVLSAALPHYQDRVLVTPGVTGLAQVNLLPDTDIDSVCRKLALDLEYIETASFWLDLRVIACTFTRIFKLGGLLWTALFGLRRDVDHHPRYVPVPEVTVASDMSSAALAKALGKNAEKHGNGNGDGHDTATVTIHNERLEDSEIVPLHRPR